MQALGSDPYRSGNLAEDRIGQGGSGKTQNKFNTFILNYVNTYSELFGNDNMSAIMFCYVK